MKLMFICNDVEMVNYAVTCGTERIFVDLEIYGKHERQGHRNTVISNHTIDDVKQVSSVIGNSELMVRVNPLHGNSESEINNVILNGADILMLPMFDSAEELKTFVDLVDERACIIPLIETPKAIENFSEICSVEGIAEFYFGLNDLHLALGLNFMFELLIDGTVERVAAACREANIPFGFGGIARMDEGLVPGALILAEHLRLGSSAVILSRTFHRAGKNLEARLSGADFAGEVRKLREHESRLIDRSKSEIETDRQKLIDCIGDVLEQYPRKGKY